MCGLIQYSVSASMTGLYPKVYDSVMTTLFGLLVLQRTSSGLYSLLKLGWLSRFSPLVNSGTGRENEQWKHDTKSHVLTLKLWKRIARIELLGYVAGGSLVGLVAFDSECFPDVHKLLATLAVSSLNIQNGWLGMSFPELFPNWPSVYAYRVYMLGLFHVALMLFLLIIVLAEKNCEDFWARTESVSMRAFGDPTAFRWFASVAL